MCFDSSAIIFGLIASVVTKWPANSSFSYGYGRVETFAAFINTAALAYASIHIFLEAVERLYEPPEIDTDQLLVVSFLGFIVNMLGIFAFEHGGHGHSHGGGSSSSHGIYPHVKRSFFTAPKQIASAATTTMADTATDTITTGTRTRVAVAATAAPAH